MKKDRDVFIEGDNLKRVFELSDDELKLFTLLILKRDIKTNIGMIDEVEIFCMHEEVWTRKKFKKIANSLVIKGIITKTDREDFYMLNPGYGIYAKETDNAPNSEFFTKLLMDYFSYRITSKPYKYITSKATKKQIAEEMLLELSDIDLKKKEI